jgi:hypothetical protein
MKVTQAPLLKQLQRDPRALGKLFSHLLKRNGSDIDTLTLDNKTYTVQRSPTILKQADL